MFDGLLSTRPTLYSFIYFLSLNLGISIVKGLERQCLIGSAVAEFNHAKTITKASATELQARQDDYNKGI